VRRVTPESLWRHGSRFAVLSGRYLTADFRATPAFIIIGTARGGTTSLYRWLCSHPDVDPAWRKEVCYFDEGYGHGKRWYRAHFPIRRKGRITGEASPYMLFHPLAPGRAARELPATTRFIVLLREPTQRAISQYWFWRKWFRRTMDGTEIESLDQALDLEHERMAESGKQVLRGEKSLEHVWFSYMAKGEYAPQIRRWFEAVGRDRILVLESESLYTERAASERILEWLGLPQHDRPYPLLNGAARLEDASPELVARLDRHFETHNRELFELLGIELWKQHATAPPADDGLDEGTA
jgi:hypothetical protein